MSPRRRDGWQRRGSPDRAAISAPLARHPGALGLTDDAAVLTPPQGSDLVLTADADRRAACISSPTIRPTRSPARPCASTSPISPPRAPSRLASCSRSRWRTTSTMHGSRPLRAGCSEDAEAVRLPAARRRHGRHARAGHRLDRGVRLVAARQHGLAQRRAGRRRRDGHRHDRRCRAWPAAAHATRCGDSAGASMARCAIICSRAISCRSRAMRSPLRCARTRPPPWTSPTASPAISPSCAASRGVAGRDRGRARAALGRPRGRPWRPSPP